MIWKQISVILGLSPRFNCFADKLLPLVSLVLAFLSVVGYFLLHVADLSLESSLDVESKITGYFRLVIFGEVGTKIFSVFFDRFTVLFSPLISFFANFLD